MRPCQKRRLGVLGSPEPGFRPQGVPTPALGRGGHGPRAQGQQRSVARTRVRRTGPCRGPERRGPQVWSAGGGAGSRAQKAPRRGGPAPQHPGAGQGPGRAPRPRSTELAGRQGRGQRPEREVLRRVGAPDPGRPGGGGSTPQEEARQARAGPVGALPGRAARERRAGSRGARVWPQRRAGLRPRPPATQACPPLPEAPRPRCQQET